MPVITVSQINRYIGSILKNDRNIQGVMVRGEICDYVRHFRSGHAYFSLKDSESSLKAVMFSSAASRLKFTPEDGMSVVVSGSIGVYERDGAYQLYVNDIIPEGAGAAGAALEQLKKKLAKEGIFDTAHKRNIPPMPKKIGAVTSLSGAAVRDIINVLSRRYPIGEIYAVNALVQGDGAADSICRGILRAESAGCDVIIVGRGGGSSEDLSAFNTEKVAYAIYNCKVPVISAVGHETDFTIADLAADLRAPTPSAAAELSAPDITSLYEKIGIYERRAERAVYSILDKTSDRFIALNARLSAQSPKNRLRLTAEKLTGLDKRREAAFLRYLQRLGSQLGEKAAKLDSLSPLKVLSRGYSLVYKEDKLLSSSEKLEKGDKIRINFGNGGAEAEITDKW
ncbi:exodeoxyribonuclease VII large subunit [Ruminococcus flavefaciens]|uniref:exodeoxyribonuclease VII large subunit n=1 Tax=Ruminococcus flavefaciens TaxID=1265 RepID=UPI0026EEE85A|nr:exodeoxyribonuclease VII large subunit [Ruminococcus flavefaciens]MDD7517168.1 exodeoxyribonuclease VII large subunit [Ruminococcus flavefaciens]MDY5690084.1 exodeoxyribonuclease VII large subunit [Ruminococcus flavefaciens]